MGNQFHGKYRLEKPDPVKVIREKLHKGTEKRQYNPAYELTPEEEQLELASHARWLNQVLNKDKKEEEKTWYPSRLTDMSEAEADRICNEAMGKTFADRPQT